jgi:hypothetical protein
MSKRVLGISFLSVLAVMGGVAAHNLALQPNLTSPSTDVRPETVAIADEPVRSFSPPAGALPKLGVRDTARVIPAAPVPAAPLAAEATVVATTSSGTWKPVVNRTDAGIEFRDRLTSVEPGDEGARAELVRSLQQELTRTRCYAGPVSGAWTAETRRALDRLLAATNAQLPTAEPDYVLLSLARGLVDGACDMPVIAAQTADNDPLENPATETAPPGRMAIGVTEDIATPPVAEPAVVDMPVEKTPSPRPRRKTTEDLFLHPLGTR